MSVLNTGDRPGREVVQVYLRDVVASVTRPVQEMAGFAGVDLAPGASARVRFSLPSDLVSFTGVDLRRIVEPGDAVVAVIGASSADIRLARRGEVTQVGDAPALAGVVTVEARRRLGWGSEVLKRSA